MGSQLKVKADLKEAFESALGTRLESAETVHLLAWYLNSLAESYGLSDHGDVNQYASERVELPQQAMEALAGVLGSDEPDDDTLRSLLYDAATAVSGDAGARRKLNQNDPPSETAVLALVQVYWNLSPDSELRPLLPLALEASQGAAPNGPLVSDALALKLTARTEAGVSCDGYQVSKAACRRQGARLAVLLADRTISEVGKESLGFPETIVLSFMDDGSTLSVEWQEREESSNTAAPFSVALGQREQWQPWTSPCLPVEG